MTANLDDFGPLGGRVRPIEIEVGFTIRNGVGDVDEDEDEKLARQLIDE